VIALKLTVIMSSGIPPFLSASPPPFDEDGPACDDDEDFGDFHDFSSAIPVPSETSFGEVGKYFHPIENCHDFVSYDQFTTSPSDTRTTVSPNGKQLPAVPLTLNSINCDDNRPTTADTTLSLNEELNRTNDKEDFYFHQNVTGFETDVSLSKFSLSSGEEHEFSSTQKPVDEDCDANVFEMSDCATGHRYTEEPVIKEYEGIASHSTLWPAAKLSDEDELVAAPKLQVCEDTIMANVYKKIESEEGVTFKALPTSNGMPIDTDLRVSSDRFEVSNSDSDSKTDDSHEYVKNESDWQTTVISQMQCPEAGAEDDEFSDFTEAPAVLSKSVGYIRDPVNSTDKMISSASVVAETIVQPMYVNQLIVDSEKEEDDDDFCAFADAPLVLTKSGIENALCYSEVVDVSMSAEFDWPTNAVQLAHKFEITEDEELSAFADAPAVHVQSSTREPGIEGEVAEAFSAPQSTAVCVAQNIDGTLSSDRILSDRNDEFGDEFDDFEEFKVAEISGTCETQPTVVSPDEQWCAFDSSAATEEDDGWAAFQEPVADSTSQKPVSTYCANIQNVSAIDKTLSGSSQVCYNVFFLSQMKNHMQDFNAEKQYYILVKVMNIFVL